MRIVRLGSKDWKELVVESDLNDVPSILQKFGLQWNKIQFLKHEVIVVNDHELFVIDPKRLAVDPADQWIWSISDWSLTNYIAPPDFNDQFWERPQILYHGTTAAKIHEIQIKGLEPRADTRGINNRLTPPAVFANESPSGTESYGEIIIVIDTPKMKQDGRTPAVSRESGIEENSIREAIAHKIGLENFQAEIEAGVDPETVVVFGTIPPQYLSVQQREVSRGRP